LVCLLTWQQQRANPLVFKPSPHNFQHTDTTRTFISIHEKNRAHALLHGRLSIHAAADHATRRCGRTAREDSSATYRFHQLGTVLKRRRELQERRRWPRRIRRLLRSLVGTCHPQMLHVFAQQEGPCSVARGVIFVRARAVCPHNRRGGLPKGPHVVSEARPRRTCAAGREGSATVRATWPTSSRRRGI
jgi:hypothetical protein